MGSAAATDKRRVSGADTLKSSNRETNSQRGEWSLVGRIVTALVTAAGFSLMLAACGAPSQSGVVQLGSTTTLANSAPGTSSISGQVSEALAFARCMRSHGVTDFPDPNANAGFNKVTMNQLASGNPSYQGATQSCAHLLPGIGGMTPALAQEIANDEAKFVGCMRSRGVANWPNPVLEQGRFIFDPQAVGIDTNSPRIAAKLQECDYVFPASVGGPPGAGHNP
jgi:hypothetical protein